MKKGLIVGGINVTITLVLAVIYFSMKISYTNANVTLKNQIIAQESSNKANFDKMKKIIVQITETAKAKMDVSTDAYKQIYPALMEGRYGNEGKNGGALMKLIVEQNPQFDLAAAGALYDKLAVAIEANRQEFFIEQQKLIDYNREQHNLIQQFPGSWFLDKSDTIAITIITSADTKEVFKTGEENDIDLFKKDEKTEPEVKTTTNKK